MAKKIVTNNNKSQVFYKLNSFEFSYDVNFKISLSKSTCFEFEDNIFKIEKSIYSINNAIHADTPLQEKPILNIDALLIEDCTEYRVNKDYLQITKEVIKDRLKKNNRVWDSSLKKVYLKNTLKQIKSLNVQIAKLGYKNEVDVEYLKQLNPLKHRLRELAVQFSTDLEEYETILLLQYLEYEVYNLSMYFIFFLDFRGRMYTISTYGPISNKIIRNILVYNTNNILGDYQNEHKESQTFNIIKDNYFRKLQPIKLKNNSDLFKCSLFWLLISLASPFKGKLLQDNKVSIDLLLDAGIDIYQGVINYKDLELDEEVELKRNIFIIKQLVVGVFDANTFICKDSTASVFQHLFVYLKPKNIEALKICNIVGSGS